jgi:Protein of unknwon function (DUF3008)
MPPVSKAQQSAAGMALAAKRDKSLVKKLSDAAKQMYESMSEEELQDFSRGTPSTPKKGTKK